MKINDIPKGKENRKTRQQLMFELKIFNEQEFKTELAKLKQSNIILFENDGYYVPDKKEDLQELIKKINKQSISSARIIDLA